MRTIGVSCTNFCVSPPEEIFTKVSGSFSHWEVFSEVDHAVQGLDKGLLERMADSGMTFSLHTSIADTDIAALNDRMRDASVCEMVSEMEWAASMGIDTVTIHPGLICLSVAGCRNRSIEAANRSCHVIDKAARELGIRNVCIENMPNIGMMIGSTAAELQAIIDGTDLGITFDIGHANTMSQIDEMIDIFGNRISHIHIHDNHGERDEHLTIGDGSVDFNHVLKRLSWYDGCYIIESKSFESAVESQKRLRTLFGE